MKRTASRPRTAIFPITIETPYGTVLLAYRVLEGKVLGKPFPVAAHPGPTLPAAAEFWASLTLDDTISDLWFASLPEAEKQAMRSDAVVSLLDA